MVPGIVVVYSPAGRSQSSITSPLDERVAHFPGFPFRINLAKQRSPPEKKTRDSLQTGTQISQLTSLSILLKKELDFKEICPSFQTPLYTHFLFRFSLRYNLFQDAGF